MQHHHHHHHPHHHRHHYHHHCHRHRHLPLSGSRQLASVVIEALLALGDIILQGEVQQSLLQGDSNKAFKLPFLGHIFVEGLTSSHLEEGSTVVIHHPGLGAATVVGARKGCIYENRLQRTRA